MPHLRLTAAVPGRSSPPVASTQFSHFWLWSSSRRWRSSALHRRSSSPTAGRPPRKKRKPALRHAAQLADGCGSRTGDDSDNEEQARITRFLNQTEERKAKLREDLEMYREKLKNIEAELKQ